MISGGGRVGSYLAGKLASRGHAVAVIEKDGAACRELATSLDAIILHGDACNWRYQEEAQTGRADVFAAVTGDDDDNLVACQLARTHFKVPRLVARVNNPKNEEIFGLMGIDAVSSTSVIAGLIEGLTEAGDITTLRTLHKGKVAMVELDMPTEGGEACGCVIEELKLPPGCVLVSISRGEEVIIPRGGDRLQAGDVVIALTFVDQEEELRRALLGKRGAVRGERGET
ncbi:MAG: TrkA family potassium uptake protein [Actinomycetota bacterium]